MSGALAIGARVDGRYVLESRLGEGAFGEVWRGRDARLSQRAVALKFLKADHGARADVNARFDAEADALALLHHPNVVGVTDRGEWRGLRYLVTELIDGQSLAEWLRAHRDAHEPTDARTAAAVFDQVCAGVEAAHAVRSPGPIVHRDLKPDNVVLQQLTGGELVAKVLDFGIAQLGGRKGTRSGAVLGTPLYMAPEQAMGISSGIGPWSDVFALGVILIEMLTLRCESDDEEPFWALAMQSRTDVLTRLAATRADVPAAVWETLARAVQAKGAERFPDAGQLRRAVRVAWGRDAEARTSSADFGNAPTVFSLSPTPSIERTSLERRASSPESATRAETPSGEGSRPSPNSPAKMNVGFGPQPPPAAPPAPAPLSPRVPTPVLEPLPTPPGPSPREAPRSASSPREASLPEVSPPAASSPEPRGAEAVPSRSSHSRVTSPGRGRRLAGALVGAAIGAVGLIALALYVAFPPAHHAEVAARDAGAPGAADALVAVTPGAPDAARADLARDAASIALAGADVAGVDAPSSAVAVGRLFAATGPSDAASAPAPPGDAPLTDHPEALALLQRWLGAITRAPAPAPLDAFYVDRPRFRGAGDNASPAVAQIYWARFFGTGGSFAVDFARSTFREEPPDAEVDAARTCDRLPGAEGPVVKVRAWAREYTPNRVPEVGCATLEGVYLVRLRRVQGALRICYETWSTREGLCASCPTARACRGIVVDAPPP